ncbi:hypothetical protein [Helicobacter sp. T3_23-1056]
MRKKLSVLILSCVLGCNVTLADNESFDFEMFYSMMKGFAIVKHMALADGKGDKAEVAVLEKEFLERVTDKEKGFRTLKILKELYDQIDIKNPKNSVEYSCGALKAAFGNNKEDIEVSLEILEMVMDADGVRDPKEIAIYEKVKKLLQ